MFFHCTVSDQEGRKGDVPLKIKIMRKVPNIFLQFKVPFTLILDSPLLYAIGFSQYFMNEEFYSINIKRLGCLYSFCFLAV